MTATMPAVTPSRLFGSLMERIRTRGLGLGRLQARYPAIDRTVRTARRALYMRKFFRDGPRHRGTVGGRTFVIVNHCYDLDVDALCAAGGPHTIWVLDPFELFCDVHHYFAPAEREWASVYGAGAMRESIARYKAAVITDVARRLRDETKLDALITPNDTTYYIRPLIEELRAIGIPSIVQCKEGTIAPSSMMDVHARQLATYAPPIADQFYFWNATHLDFWRRVGVPDGRMKMPGQPRSDFFFHEDRWPSKASLGLTEGKKLVVAFTFDTDAYVRVTEPDPTRPWKSLRDHMHQTLQALARERDDVEVVIKAHPQQAELGEIEAELARDPVPNVHVMTGAKSASHLMVRADVILGFQSTAMIEAMLTAKPVIYVGWGERHDELTHALIPIHHSEGCAVPQSRAELDRAVRDAVDGTLTPSPETMRARRAFTDKYFFGADGNCAKRVLDLAAEFVATRPRP
jgi:hypothetical protein